MHILPKISFLPALVAGFFLVLILQRPGRVKTPDFFTSHEVATASANAPFVMAALFIALGAIAKQQT